MSQDRKSIMDQYMDIIQKDSEGTPLSKKEKAIIALVRTRDVTLAVTRTAAHIALLPIIVPYNACSLLKKQWQAAASKRKAQEKKPDQKNTPPAQPPTP